MKPSVVPRAFQTLWFSHCGSRGTVCLFTSVVTVLAKPDENRGRARFCAVRQPCQRMSVTNAFLSVILSAFTQGSLSELSARSGWITAFYEQFRESILSIYNTMYFCFICMKQSFPAYFKTLDTTQKRVLNVILLSWHLEDDRKTPAALLAGQPVSLWRDNISIFGGSLTLFQEQLVQAKASQPDAAARSALFSCLATLTSRLMLQPRLAANAFLLFLFISLT